MGNGGIAITWNFSNPFYTILSYTIAKLLSFSMNCKLFLGVADFFQESGRFFQENGKQKTPAGGISCGCIKNIFVPLFYSFTPAFSSFSFISGEFLMDNAFFQ